MNLRHFALGLLIVTTCSACFPFLEQDPARFRREVRHEGAWLAGGRIRVVSENGGIEITRSDSDSVLVEGEIRATTEERAASALLAYETTTDGQIEVSIRWPAGGRKPSEGCHFKLHLPEASLVRAESGNGAISVRGFAAQLELRSGNGHIEAKNCSGSVNAETSNGAVEVAGPASRVHAKTSNGRILVTGALGEVKAITSNGAVEIDLADSNPGPATLETSNGGLSLRAGKAFHGALKAETSNGRVSGELPAGATVHRRSKTSVDAQWGADTHRSELSTSNGGIELEFRSR